VRWQDGEPRRDIIPVVAFGKLGECIMTHVKPGDLLEVMANLATNQFMTAMGAVIPCVCVVAIRPRPYSIGTAMVRLRPLAS
jgi:single-stranded DNA-binding protein